jgi:hypothetical protein
MVILKTLVTKHLPCDCLNNAQLIAEALNNAPEKTLVLSNIYKATNAEYPFATFYLWRVSSPEL